MRKDAYPQHQWPTPDILRRARFVDDAGPIRFVDTEAAARYLALEAHTLECYRSLVGGPIFHKFGKWVRYAVDDLDAWAESCRKSIVTHDHRRTADPGSRSAGYPVDRRESGLAYRLACRFDRPPSPWPALN
jgi:hypothetical protein